MDKEMTGIMEKLMKKSKRDWDKSEAEHKKKQDEENAKMSPDMRKMVAYSMLGSLAMKLSEKE